MHGSSSTKRRQANSDQLEERSPKALKIHPFFERRQIANDSFKWLESLGPARSCLHGINLEPAKIQQKIAAFDLDGTLIKYNASATEEWSWWTPTIPVKLKEVHDAGHSIVIVSNQAINPLALKKWKQKITSIAAALSDVPFRLYAAIAKDQYRKPMPGIWYELEHTADMDGIEIDKTASFFVGDAAGRQYYSAKKDFASTDRKWALNVGIKFHTPEEYFLQHPIHQNIVLPGFHVSSLPNLPFFTPTSKPLLPLSSGQEVVLFVGYPCVGKTTLFHRVFKPAGYMHVNQDNLRTRTKCVNAVRDFLHDGLSCVVDNTNRDRATRKLYIDLAREYNIIIRCFIFSGSIELAWHNNLYRAFNLPPSLAETDPTRKLLPYSAFTSFSGNYEEPREDEGYLEIKRINWDFHGTDEERRRWSMWLQIYGK